MGSGSWCSSFCNHDNGVNFCSAATYPRSREVSLSPSCIRQVNNLVLKENTGIALALIGADEVASHINATATQVFDVETRGDSSVEESDGSDSDLDYGDDERTSVLPEKMRRMSKLQRVMWSLQPQLGVIVYNSNRL